MARGPLCSSPEPKYTLDHGADPLGTGACIAIPECRPGVIHILVDQLLIQKMCIFVFGTFFTRSLDKRNDWRMR